MSAPFTRAHLGLALLLIAGLAGCATSSGTDASASPSSISTPSASDVTSHALIDCVTSDGSTAGPFTRLEEAWASTNYVRIDSCTAAVESGADVALTPEEARVAETAAADLPDEDRVQLFLRTLASCVRIPATGDEGLTGLPASLLRATVELCPDAPQAGLIGAELEARQQG